MDSYKLKFENGRSCTIECDSTKSFQDKINEAEMRYNSECVSINDKPIKKHSLGGFLVGATIGGIMGNSVPVHTVSKTAKGVKRTAKKVTSTVKKQVKKFSGGGGVDERETNIAKILKEYSYPLTNAQLKEISDKTGYSMGDIEFVSQKINNDIQYNPKYAGGGRIIEFEDGFQFEEVSEEYAKTHWQDEAIYGINEDEQTEGLIEDESDLDAYYVYAKEIGFKDKYAGGGRTPTRKYAISGGGLAEEYIVEATNKDEAIEKARRSLKTVFGNVPKNRFSYRVVGKFAGGGGLPKGKYMVLAELYNLYHNGYSTVQLNGFSESIGYVIGLQLDDTEIKKVGERSYITLYSKGGSTGYNRSWHFDHNRHNKSESYEVPKSDRKKYSGGGVPNMTYQIDFYGGAEDFDDNGYAMSMGAEVIEFQSENDKKAIDYAISNYSDVYSITNKTTEKVIYEDGKIKKFSGGGSTGLEVFNLGGDAYDGGIVWEVRQNGKVIEQGLIDGEWGIKFQGKEYKGLVDLAKQLKAPLHVISDNKVYQPEELEKFSGGGGVEKTPRWWNKQVREYEFFVFNTETNKVWAGNEYLNDAKDELKEFLLDNPKLPLKVLSKRAITNKKINPLAYENWARSSEQFEAIKKFSGGGLTDSELERIASDYAYATSGNEERATWRLLDPDFTQTLLPQYIHAIKDWEAKNNTSIRAGEKPYSELYPSYADGGMSSMAVAGAMPELAIADEVSKRLPETTSAIDRRIASRLDPNRPKWYEDRGLQPTYATGGMVGRDITFDRWGEHKVGTITEVLPDGNFSVSSGMGSYLVSPDNVISFSAEKQEKKGWFFAKGGSTGYNYSWHFDHNRHNKSESYEVPKSDRKKFSGGGKTPQRYQILSPDGFPLYRDRTFTEEEILPAFEEWKKRYEKQGYYSTSNRERIDLDDLGDMVSVIEVSDEDYED